jgi:hypothetical protein
MDVKQAVKGAPTWLKIAVVAVGAIVAAPLAVMAVKGLIGIAIAIVVAGIIIFGAPPLLDFLATMSLKAFKANAWGNPIEKLERIYKERVEALAVFKKKLEEFSGAIETFRSQVRTFSVKYPQRAPEFKKRLEQMETLKQVRLQKYQQARKNIEQFSNVIDEARAVYEMALAAQTVTKAAGFEEDPMNEIMQKTALGSVESAMNTAIGELEMAMADEAEGHVIDIEGEVVPQKAAPQLTQQRPVVLPAPSVSSISVKERIKR